MDFLTKIEQINSIESQLIELKPEINNILNNFFETNNIEILNTYKNLELNKNKLLNEIQSEKHILGEQIRINFGLTIETINDWLFGKMQNGRSLKNTKKVIDEIEYILTEIKSNYEILEKIETKDTSEFEEDIQYKEETKIQNKYTFPLEEYILDPRKEFSDFCLNNKSGKSLKDFVNLNRVDIQKLLNHFNSKEKVLTYLKKYHGLCNQENISPNNWNQMLSSFKFEDESKLRIFVNNNTFCESSDWNTIFMALEDVGLSNVMKYCSQFFGSSFLVSKSKIQYSYGSQKEVIQNDIKYYIHLHGSNNKKHLLLQNIKKVLNKNNIMFDFEEGKNK